MDRGTLTLKNAFFCLAYVRCLKCISNDIKNAVYINYLLYTINTVELQIEAYLIIVILQLLSASLYLYMKILDSFSYSQVVIDQTQSHASSHDVYGRVSSEDEMSYGGLFYSSSTSGRHKEADENSFLIEDGSGFKMSFKVRKVQIDRSWLDPTILHHPTLGIMGLPSGSWSSGQLDTQVNHGSFPLLPTAMIVAKDVEMSAKLFSKSLEDKFSEMSSNASMKVCM